MVFTELIAFLYIYSSLPYINLRCFLKLLFLLCYYLFLFGQCSAPYVNEDMRDMHVNSPDCSQGLYLLMTPIKHWRHLHPE